VVVVVVALGLTVVVVALGVTDVVVAAEVVAAVVVSVDGAAVVVPVVGSDVVVEAPALGDVVVCDGDVVVTVTSDPGVDGTLVTSGGVDTVVVSVMTGSGSSVNGEDGSSGIGCPGGGSVAAGSCSTTL
jgi:hypothetical protein